MLQKTVKNRTIFCRDNIEILRGIDSNTIDLIYLDPPFNKKKVFTAPIGSSAEGASFKDWFRQEDVKEEWVQTIEEDNEKLYAFLESVKVLDGRKSYNFCYLTYMAIRLIECQRILKDTGSIYLHCDPTMSHYLKILLDILFGESNFRNEIAWCYKDVGGGRNTDYYKRKHDIVLWFCKNNKEKKVVEMDRGPLSDETLKVYGRHFVNGKMTYRQLKEKYPNTFRTREKQGRVPKNLDEVWLDEERGKQLEDWWVDINPIRNRKKNADIKELFRYPTQKPLALLERIIKTSSNEGDVVLDPFCGCATSCVASEKLGRQWIGIDISVKAYDLVKARLAKEVADPENLLQYKNEIHFSTTPPKRTDSGEDLSNKKYVYIISNKRYKNEYKVGIASDVKARLNGYQTSDPNRAYRLEYSIHTDKFREIEKYIHEKFDNRHEWVRDELKDIIKAIEGYEKAK